MKVFMFLLQVPLFFTVLESDSKLISIISFAPLSKDILSLEILTVEGHIKRGEYVSSHLHLNVTYLLTADIHDELHIKPDENSGIRWFTFDEAKKASSEPWFVEHIYPKLNAKVKKFIC